MSTVDTPVTELRLVDETALENEDPDLLFTKRQLDRMSNSMLRNLAAHANTDAIHGKSTQLEIRSYFRCQRTLCEYE